jgi:O-acetyl-ADP-ribose deacetylase (regulator of RNase III)
MSASAAVVWPAVIHWNRVQGDLLQQDVDALVNPWNRNFVPRLLLRPGGVSGQLKRATGPHPWHELARKGWSPLGGACITVGGMLQRDLIHVAGLNLRWKATPESVRESVCSALDAAWEAGYASIALPLIGAGTGGLPAADVEEEIAAVLDVYAAGPGERGRVLQVTLVTPEIGRAA